MPIDLDVNGARRALDLPDGATLLEALRGPLDLTGAKPACDMGECGACAVLVDGTPHLACITLAAEVEGRTITTVEGLGGADGGLHPVQQAFHDRGAAQCGYCTPGLIVCAAALLAAQPDPDEGIVREALAGCLCRCTGYTRILEAVMDAARVMRPRP